MSLPEVVESFLTYERLSRRVTPGTEALYRFYLTRFLRVVERNEWSGRTVEPRMIDAFLAGLRVGDEAQRSAFGVLRWFFRWSFERRHVADNPMKDMKPPIVRDKPRVVLTPAQAERLLEAVIGSRRRYAQRDHALVSVLYYAGLRVSEAVALRAEDVDFGAGELRVIGKGGRSRVVPLNAKLARTVKAWARGRGIAVGWLFPSQVQAIGAGRLDPHNFTKDLRTVYAPRAGLGLRVTPHTLRRSFATNLVRAGVPLPVVQQLLGHASLNTTRRYIQVSPAELREAVKKL